MLHPSHHNPLNPMSMKSDYRDYLETDHWQQLRVLCHARYNGKCVICHNSKTLQCHHWIYRRAFQDTTVEDLVLLCDSCHGMVHKEGSNTLNADALLLRYSRFFEKQRVRNAQKKKKVKPIVRKPKWKPFEHRITTREEKLRSRLDRLNKKQKKHKNQQRQKEVSILSAVIKKIRESTPKPRQPIVVRHLPAMPVYDWASKQWTSPR